MIAGTLEVDMLANIKRLQKDMDDAKEKVNESVRRIEKATSAAKAALANLAVLTANFPTRRARKRGKAK